LEQAIYKWLQDHQHIPLADREALLKTAHLAYLAPSPELLNMQLRRLETLARSAAEDFWSYFHAIFLGVE